MLRAGWIIVLTLGALGARGWSAAAQSYTETEQVTVIDLAVELRSLTRPDAPAQKPPPNLLAGDFEILIDGQPQPAVAVAPVVASGPLPSHILIYVEPELSDGRELEGSIDVLAASASELMQRSTVDVVIADPEPRFLVQSGTDPEILENLLASADWEETAGDRLRALRVDFLEALSDTETEFDLRTLQLAFAREEGRLVQQRLDLLLSFVADNGVAGKQGVLMLAGLQFDPEPMRFYGSWGEDDSEAADTETSSGSGLEPSLRSLGTSLAALGWITHPIAAPEAESLLRPGLRIGKWRVTGPAGGRVIGVRIARESERDPDLARGYLRNGQALLEQGDPVAAEKAFRQALHHFYGDRRTADEQAQALAGLSQALEAQGRATKARSIMRQASDLDAAVAAEHREALAILLEPNAALDILAQETSGRVLYESQELQSALVDLERRLWLSFQLAGSPRGEVFPVEVRSLRGGWVARGPRWARFGPPPGVARARIRLLHDGDWVESAVVLDGRLERPADGDAAARLEYRLPAVDQGPEDRPEDELDCRITMATLTVDEPVRVEQRPLPCRWMNGALGGSTEVRLPPAVDLVGVLIEHLATGTWGADIFEVESR